MAIDAWRDRRRLAARLAKARTLWLASDFDGTLVPIKDHPVAVRTSLSARRLADLDRTLGVRGVFLSGLGGLETRRPGRRVRRHVPARRRLDPALRQRLEAWVSGFAGAWLEDKELCWAIHDRAVEPRL